MEIKPIREADIEKVVLIHLSAFPGFFLTELGDEFLQLYYSAVRKHKDGLLFGYFEGESLLGFSAATIRSRGFHMSLVKANFFRFSVFGLRFLLGKFQTLLRLVKNLTKKTGKNIADEGEYAELVSIGIQSDQQGKGIGKLLIARLEEELLKKDVRSLSLTTDYLNNEKTIRFYHSIGFSILYDFIAYPNRKMYRLIKQLN